MSYNKYYVYKQQVSYDGGSTWQYTGNETPSGDSIGEYETLEECEGGGPTPPHYDNEFLFDDQTSIRDLSVANAGGSFNIGVISYVNGSQTDLYSLVVKDMWIEYNSHTATGFRITVEPNDGSSRDGSLTLRQNQTGKIITLNVHQN